MKKKPLYFLLCLLLISLMTGLYTKFSIKEMDTSAVKDTINHLSDPYFKGRLAGTLENAEVAQYIKNEFQKNGLAPYQGDYMQSFEVNYPKKENKSPYLRAVDKNGNVIKEFKYNEDFREDMINFKKNYVDFKLNSSVHMEKDSINIVDNNSYFAFFTTSDNSINFRSSFFTDSVINMAVIVNKETLDQLKDSLSNGLSIQCYIPFTVEKTTINNVFGVIEGKDRDAAPVIISAHFDHLGSDLSGTVYSGALDNASGTAFMLEMVKYVKSLGKPNRDIVFIGFNAEEFGCLGSKAFVDKYKNDLQGSKVFNFDMIGSDYGIPLCIMGSKTDTSKTDLIKSAATVCLDNNIHFNYLFQDSSDHEYFRKNGIDAITFIDNDTSKIHTPLDQDAVISEKAIERCFNVVSKEVVKYGYNSNPLILYCDKIIQYSAIALLSLVLIVIVSGYLYREKGPKE